MVDGVPTYVARNDNNGNESVFHHTRLLLWIAADADGDDSMRSNPIIAVLDADGLAEEDKIVECVVSQDMTYGLSLAMFKTMIGSPHHMTGCKARAPQSGVMQKGVGHMPSEQKGQQPLMTGDIVKVEDILP